MDDGTGRVRGQSGRPSTWTLDRSSLHSSSLPVLHFSAHLVDCMYAAVDPQGPLLDVHLGNASKVPCLALLDGVTGYLFTAKLRIDTPTFLVLPRHYVAHRPLSRTGQGSML